MESPRRPPATSVETSCLSDVSFTRPDSPLQRPNDSYAESQQCSADPSAFLGFHVPPGVEEVTLEQNKPQHTHKQTLKLVLDLDATTSSVTRGGDGFRPASTSQLSPILTSNPFSELFEGDTQDDENLEMKQVTETKEQLIQKRKEASSLKRRRERGGDAGNRSPSPPPTMLATIDSEWRAHKIKVAGNLAEGRETVGDVKSLKKQTGEKDRVSGEVCEEAHAADASMDVEKLADDLVPESSAYSEYSEDLAPRIFQVAAEVPAREANESCGKKSDNGKVDLDDIAEDSDRETDYEDELECTQPLDDDEPDADVVVTRNYEIATNNCAEEDTEVYPHSDTGTQSYGANSISIDEMEANTSQHLTKGETLAFVPTPDQVYYQRGVEDEVTSREVSQATQQDYLTPRVNPTRVEQTDTAQLCGNFALKVSPRGNDEQCSQKSNGDDDTDECVSTQPSKPRTEGEPVVEPNSPSQPNISKESDVLMTSKPTETDSQTKAIRTLEFSFSMPGSEEGDSQLSANLSSEETVVSKKRFHADPHKDKTSPFESSISPVWPPTPKPVNGSAEKAASLKRKTTASSGLPTGKKQKTCGEVAESPSPTKTKRRNPEFFSPGSSTSNGVNEGNPQTPRPPARRSTRSSQSTPSSTPTVRTRTKILTPVPSQRAYASRSRTLFKYKFEFCLTGFVKTGEENLKELIEGHGGKIPERYQDVLYKNNAKAVLIATPVSWRKRKFMQAIACGIPVVHTDWIHDCIQAGYVIPFDGYQVPTGYSVTTRKFECFPPTELDIFEGFSFGIVSDVEQTSKAEAKDKASLIALILKACGADAVYENLSTKSSLNVDVVLCDEYTQTCRYYKKRRHVPVKDFQWVTECMILQQFLDPKEPTFEPQRVGCEDVSAASAEIGDSDNTTLKLHTGELVMADISGSAADHYLLFNVCEILSIHVNARNDEGSQSKRKDKGNRVLLRVGMLKREPYNPELSKSPVKELEISSSQVKRRVVAISKDDYGKLKYKDESIFYLEAESKSDRCAVSEHKWLTQ